MTLTTKKRIRLKRVVVRALAHFGRRANPTRLWFPVGALSAAAPNFGKKG